MAGLVGQNISFLALLSLSSLPELSFATCEWVRLADGAGPTADASCVASLGIACLHGCMWPSRPGARGAMLGDEVAGRGPCYLRVFLRSSLRTTGIYEYVRHPIYGGLVLLCLGIAVVTNSAELNRLQ